ncbi:MAG: threonine--tRNA ligase [Patescibacteria group bacterium]
MKNDSLEGRRHSCAHLLAAAVRSLWPNAKNAIGPAIEEGFYQDCDLDDVKIGEEDLPRIEEKMREILATWGPFQVKEVTAEQARKDFAWNPYKLELIDQFAGEGKMITENDPGNFLDLCRGGHSENPQEEMKYFKLLSVAGAYWRGDEKNKMLTRIYGTCFPTQEELDSYLTLREEAKKRDHRKLGTELELFTIIDEVGPGLPLFYPRGAMLRRTVENFIIEQQEKRGYVPIWIPHITKGRLYEMSGHLQKYDAMYPPMNLKDEAQYYLKPMNCPHFMMLYKTLPHSYRELPMRWTCTTTNYRYEKSGELSGLTRVRSLTQDDCHVFARPEQIEQEINLMLDMVDETYRTFGFKDFWVRISTHDPENKEKYIGDPEIWKQSEAALSRLIESRGWEHEVGVGEAAFYGPKLDFMAKDVIGRQWQLSTIQLDMNLPERFELEYADVDGTKKRPVVIHRAILGSTERFLGILIEHYGGAFPFWLAPVQIRLATVSEAFVEYAKKISAELMEAGIRVELDVSDEKVGKKIRNSAMMKIPWTIVIGQKEVEGGAMKVNVFGQEEDVMIEQSELVVHARDASKRPLL